MNEKLIKWSEKHYSHLPWRVKRSLYHTLVSEIMLQQTTVATVINHFEKFITKYPDIKTLAKISEEQILKDWKGLGYYRRAKNLLKAAKQIEQEFAGNIPLEFEKLIKINGIGEYTASALIAIGENLPALAVDANLERVLSRFYNLRSQKGIKLQKEIKEKFQNGDIAKEMQMLGPRLYNEALMDLGRSLCRARSASCEICPVGESCASRGKNPLELPLSNEDKKIENHELHLVRFIVQKNNQILVYKKSEKQWLSGQYELPTFILKTDDPKLTQYPKLKNEDLFHLPQFVTGITKYKITNYIIHTDEREFPILKSGFEYKALAGLNLSTASLKALKAY